MRKKFVFFALVPTIIVIVLVYLFINSWITSGLESAGEAITGAKVEIERLAVTVSPLGIRWGRMQVANPKEPMKNLFETGRVQFALNFAQLLRGKYIIETMEVNDFILGTRRSTSGALPKKRKSETKSKGPSPFTAMFARAATAIGAENVQTPNFDIATVKKLLNIDSLTNPRSLQTYRVIDSLRQQLESASVQWQSTLKEIDQTKEKLAKIETNVKSIDVNQLKTVDQITSALNTIKTSVNSANEVKQSFTARSKDLTDRVNTFASSVGSIDDAVNKDFNRIVSLARLPDINMKDLSEIVLGKEILNKADTYLYWIGFAREKVQNYQLAQKEPSPPRMKGQNIHFPEERGYPKFWIRKILISGGTDKKQDPQYFYARGEVHNITDNQRIAGSPLTINLLLTKGSSLSLKLAALFDRRKDIPLDTYEAVLTGAKLGSMNFGRSNFLPSKVVNISANASVNVRIPGNTFDSNMKMSFTNLDFVFESQPRNTVERIVQQVLQSVKSFSVNLRMWDTGEKFKLAFSTDLDEQLASRVKSVLGGELARFEDDIRNKLDQRIAEKRKEYEALFAQKRDAVMSQLKGYETYVNSGIAMVQGKQNEILKKQQDALKSKAGELLKGIIPH